LSPGSGGEEVLAQWMGWSRGRHYEVNEGGLEFVGVGERAKL
jgi:alpha-methylacyl-CoA racemase